MIRGHSDELKVTWGATATVQDTKSDAIEANVPEQSSGSQDRKQGHLKTHRGGNAAPDVAPPRCLVLSGSEAERLGSVRALGLRIRCRESLGCGSQVEKGLRIVLMP
jgi:hypothetical protein